MMTIVEKIKLLYPSLKNDDFVSLIVLQNDDGQDYIEEWNHPTFEKPTDEQLKGL